MNTQKQIALIVILSFMLVGGCAAYTVVDLPIRAEDQTEWHQEQSIERGALLFANNCRTCHGIKGEGGVGPQLNKPEFKNQDPLVLANTRALLTRTLYCGRAGTLMPAWLNTNGGSLNDRQIEHLVDLLTAPATEDETDDAGLASNFGWSEAEHFAENLNHEVALVVGGDTVGTIAKDHGVGVADLVRANGNQNPDQVLKKGTVVHMPVSNGRPDGRDYKVSKDNETLRKIADSHLVGAMIVADLNGIPYSVDEKGLRLQLADSNVSRSTGLIPFATLKLPEGVTYTVRAGDKIAAVATKHGVSASSIASLNPGVVPSDANAEIPSVFSLTLPANATVVVEASDTLATIAQTHGIDVAALVAANSGMTATTAIKPGDQIKLPANAKYLVQTGDTLVSVARHHGLQEAALAQLNNMQPGTILRPEVELKLPKVDALVIQGQTLEDIAKTLSGVTAASLGEAQNPPAEANAIYAIGTTLTMPHDAWGGAPPDAKNPGTACVQHAVPDSVFTTIVGGGAAPAKPTAPAQNSTSVEIDANAADWTVNADGTAQPANQGVVAVAVGTRVNFVAKAGLHDITINGTKVQEPFGLGGPSSYQQTFSQAGDFHVTCTIHPQMSAWVFVK